MSARNTQVPEGTVIGARGPFGPFAPDSALNNWFRKAYEERSKKNSDVKAPGDVPGPAPAAPAAPAPRDEDAFVTGDGASFPPSATMCGKCSTRATVIMDGCATCLNCGYSKCG